MSAPTIAELGATIADRMRELDQALMAALDSVHRAADKTAEIAEPFIGKDEAAKFLNMSVSTLERRMEEKLGPPRYTDGGKVNFLRSELKEWRRKWRVGAV